VVGESEEHMPFAQCNSAVGPCHGVGLAHAGCVPECGDFGNLYDATNK
jgi:hypothetical protein